MSKENIRAFVNRKKRNKFGLPIIISLEDDKIKLPARLNDINDEGLSFKCNIAFKSGDVFDINIPFPKGILFFDEENINPLRVSIQIRWCTPYSDKEDFLVKFLYGGKIISSNDTDFENKIKKLIKLSEQLGQKPLGY